MDLSKAWALVEAYGLSVLVIAVSIIAFIGVLKLCKVFDKIQNKELKKFIYYAIDIVLAFGGSAIYFAAFKLDWSAFVAYSVAELTVVTTLYSIYEHLGGRKFVRWIIGLVAKWVKKNPDAQLSKWANKVGLETAIEKINVEIETAKKKEAEELAKENAKAEAAKVAENTALKTETIEINETTV